MNRMFAVIACALPGMALAATRTYEIKEFDAVSVAAGVDADITLGPTHSVVAEAGAESFDKLRISVEDKVLRIDRAPRSWLEELFAWTHDGYRVHVATPALHSLTASSGAEVTITGNLAGNFSVTASSGSDVKAAHVRGGTVRATTSSGSDIEIAGSCISLEAKASSGSDLDAKDLKCENVTVHASSGSDVAVAASKRVDGSASSGSDVQVRGRPPVVQVGSSSGSNVTVRD